MSIKRYLQGLREEGLKNYFRDRKLLFILIAFIWFLRSGFIRGTFKSRGFWMGFEIILLDALLGVMLFLLWKAAYFLFHRWRYGKELEEWKAKEATPEYQEWFNSLTPEEQLVELQKKNNIIAEQTMKTSKTTTAASVLTAGAAGAAADAAEKIAKVVNVKK